MPRDLRKSRLYARETPLRLPRFRAGEPSLLCRAVPCKRCRRFQASTSVAECFDCLSADLVRLEHRVHTPLDALLRAMSTGILSFDELVDVLCKNTWV